MKNFIIIILLSVFLYSCSDSPVSPVSNITGSSTNTIKNKDFESNPNLFLDVNSIAEISFDNNFQIRDNSGNSIAKIPFKVNENGLYKIKKTSSKINLKVYDDKNYELAEINNDLENSEITLEAGLTYSVNIFLNENESVNTNDKIYANWNEGMGNTLKTLEINFNNCENCTFINTSFYQTYSNINYNGSTFDKCYFGNAVMQNCSFQNALFQNNEMATSQFQTSDFTNADFYNNTVYDCVFYDTCIFISTTVSGGSFGASGFINNSMQGMSFKPSSVYATNFGGCNLQSANLVNYSSIMQDSAVSFIGCDLSYAQVVKYNLSHSNLSGSNFTFTNFMFSNLSYANIGASTFYNTNLNNANMCNVTGSPFVFKFVSQIGTQCPYKN